jgi:hypothetical protein
LAAAALLKEQPDFSLVQGGALFQMLRRAHLTGPALELQRRRVIFFWFLCWVPLAALSLAEGHLLGGAKFSFLRDVETQVRFLVSLPVLILAEVLIHRRLRHVVQNFIKRRLVGTKDLPRFYVIADSAMRMRNSVIAEIALAVLVFTGGIWIWRIEVALDVASWYASPRGGQMHLTSAGTWFAFVSVPVFQFILMRWYVRMLIWFWLLLRASLLSLRLQPEHPDRAGGLGFVGGSSIAFTPFLFAQGALIAGQIANRILFMGSRCFHSS